MPTFPIINPKVFVLELLDFLSQGYAYLLGRKTKNNNKIGSIGGILTPTLAPNHLQHHQKLTTANKRENMDELLTEYNRSKARNQIEKSDNVAPKTDFLSKNNDPIESIISALKALISVIKSNSNVELQCIGQFDMLFGFVSTSLCDCDKEIKALGLEIVSLVSRNKDCVTEIAECEILGKFLIALKDEDLKTMQMKVLETLSGLLNVQRMVKEAQSKGAVIYLLDLFCNSRNPQIREFCAELLGKMTADKLTGPKVKTKFSIE